jgi:hypothetical protein
VWVFIEEYDEWYVEDCESEGRDRMQRIDRLFEGVETVAGFYTPTFEQAAEEFCPQGGCVDTAESMVDAQAKEILQTVDITLDAAAQYNTTSTFLNDTQNLLNEMEVDIDVQETFNMFDDFVSNDDSYTWFFDTFKEGLSNTGIFRKGERQAQKP